MASDEIHKSLSRLLLAHARFEHSALSDSWRSIEQKAQGTIAIVGVFMAVATFVTTKLSALGDVVRLMLLFSIVLLAGAALFAIAALLVRTFDAIEGTEDISKGAAAVVNAADDYESKLAIRQYVQERIEGQIAANTALHRENARKASLVARAQWALRIGVMLLTLSYGALIVTHPEQNKHVPQRPSAGVR